MHYLLHLVCWVDPSVIHVITRTCCFPRCFHKDNHISVIKSRKPVMVWGEKERTTVSGYSLGSLIPTGCWVLPRGSPLAYIWDDGHYALSWGHT